jgi:hypothetical protein
VEIPSEVVENVDRESGGILAIPGVIGIGVGMLEEDGELFDELAVRIFVDPDVEIPVDVPFEVGGVRTCIIRDKFVPCAIPDEAFYNEIAGGIKIEGPSEFGTFGVVVKDISAGGSGELLGLSCQHVVGLPGNIFPDTVWQPTRPPRIVGTIPARTDNIGEVIRADIPVQGPVIDELWTYSDSAVFRLSEAQSQQRSISAKILGHDGPPILANHIIETAFPVSGVSVLKRGYMTGITKGLITNPILYYKWEILGPKAFLVGQWEIFGDQSNPNDIFGRRGDSGSLIVQETKPTTAVGLLSGSRMGGKIGIMAPITTVEINLKVKVAWSNP